MELCLKQWLKKKLLHMYISNIVSMCLFSVARQNQGPKFNVTSTVELQDASSALQSLQTETLHRDIKKCIGLIIFCFWIYMPRRSYVLCLAAPEKYGLYRTAATKQISGGGDLGGGRLKYSSRCSNLEQVLD
mmetsp:Transcript_33779/g.43162  ORF Transcript_33779/g.43162 Transcript_33779/m.43162 type:complete len:132 (+) Transcript_33779:77-472(+)